MGNSQPKYITSLEALDIIGDETWDRLRKQLVRWRIPSDSQSNRVNNYNSNNNNNQGAIAMDYNYFAKIIYTHFPYIPKQLLDGLYLGFTSDLNARIDVDDFITTLAVIAGQNKQQILRFLFRIYDIRGTGYLERVNVERLLRLAYGSKYNSDIEVINKHIDKLFQRQTTDGHDFRVPSSLLTLKDFESANVPLRELGEWVQVVLSVFTNPLPTKLLDLERRYSSIVTNKEMCDKYPVTESECDQLRGVFSHLFGNSRRQPSISLNKLEMSLDMWKDVSENYLTPTLSAFIFLISSISLKPIWRFGEFVEFCFLFGKLDLEAQANHLCESCHRHYRRYARTTTLSFQSSMRRLVLLLAHGFAPSDSDNQTNNFKGMNINYESLETIESLELRIFLPNTIREALEVIERIEDPPLHIYKDLIIQFNSYLPGLRDLSLLASCHFGVKPSEPLLEKEYIMELMVRRQFTAPQTRAQPNGPIGTEWCVIVRHWINHWKLYVGQKRLINNNDSSNNLSTSSSNSPSNLTNPPGEIDNWSVLKKTGPKQLLQGIMLNHHIEVVAPNVYTALQMWYSGGPRIQRKVILTKRSTLTTSELELFPLCLKICSCDHLGKARDTEREVLFSRMSTVQDVINELSEARRLESTRVRLWNYAMTSWKDQFVLSPSLSLEEANLQDGQSLLLEVSLPDGTWPRSQLHARLDDEEKSKQTIKRVSIEDDINDSKEINPPKRLNDGKVGLDNLGNTCYLNSSLQALIHTKPLVDYFIHKQHLHDVNYYSKHGFNGRLALSFGRLIEELYSSSKKSMSPRLFVNDLITLHSQFSGNQQHDAQELLAVLLDGLSEDLNLVDEKPYTTQPDSDGRSDEVLADIWWDNHLQRDLSLIQALFMGQFKSLMTCDHCEYVSARFEPFNILALPLPEDQLRVFTVHVVHLGSAHAVLAMVRVDKRSDLYALVDAISKLQLNQNIESDLTDQSTTTKPSNKYVVVEVINSRVNALFSLERKLEMIRDGENVFLYETTEFHRGLQRGNKSIQLPISDQQINRSNDLIIPTTPTENDANDEKTEITIGNRVSFVQRRVRFRSDPSQGTEAFVHDLFGLPFVEVIPSRVTGRYLYDLINERVGRYLKASISSLLEHYEGNLSSISNYKSEICSYSTDDLVAGPINRVGFVLRLVVGGVGHCMGCARCSWLTGCQGCLLPDDTDLDISLRDGETIAIDWHVAVFEELLDSNSASDVKKHSSFNSKINLENSTPLRRCLDKFTEDEPLEGVVCPKCKRDDKLRKSFAIWRCPPVLVVQLKRFQFDNTSRRKLNNRVDFPIDGLDLSPYIVPRNDSQATNSNCTEYDLYSSVHHIGALSGGHYVTTVRHKRDGSTVDDWLLYNDDVISELRDLRDLCSPTAYLLFYIRKDIKDLNVDELFQPFRSRAPPKRAVNAKQSKHLEVNSDNNRRIQVNERSLITKYLPRLSITSASENVLTNRRGSNSYDPENGGFCMPS